MSQNTLVLFTPALPRYATIDAAVGYHGTDGAYTISDHGAIDSFKRGEEWRPRVLSPDEDGYLLASLSYRSQSVIVYAHILVAHYFIGNCPPGLEVCHNDNIRSNNHYLNLRYDTRAGNQHDRILHGTDLRGEKNPLAKLTWDRVRDIRSKGSPESRPRVPINTLAREYGVSGGAIRSVLNYRTWVET